MIFYHINSTNSVHFSIQYLNSSFHFIFSFGIDINSDIHTIRICIVRVTWFFISPFHFFDSLSFLTLFLAHILATRFWHLTDIFRIILFFPHFNCTLFSRFSLMTFFSLIHNVNLTHCVCVCVLESCINQKHRQKNTAIFCAHMSRIKATMKSSCGIFETLLTRTHTHTGTQNCKLFHAA